MLTTKVHLVKVVHGDENLRVIYGKVCAIGKDVLAWPIVRFWSVHNGRVIVAYGVQPGRIRRIYTDNSVYIIRCAVWRVSKIGRGLFGLVVKTPGCYNDSHKACVFEVLSPLPPAQL
jgi:hypothetical protein